MHEAVGQDTCEIQREHETEGLGLTYYHRGWNEK